MTLKMEMEEWFSWQKLLPEITDRIAPDTYSPPWPERAQCLEALEMRAFAMTLDQLDRFQAVISNLPFHKLAGEDLELILRVYLQARGGRHADLQLGEIGRRILAAAEKSDTITCTYLSEFRTLVHAELE
ncbi:MAG: hypothetical protein ACYTGH_04410 [Planctomycetota bacterium]|jgi:hypothetical protein